ncbi:dyslexia-associated protein KIAA0319 homolog isoform X1 [Monodelphis domestica]|uniref:dyslexia-associated protein KIAA0319 homolog isoform X1 n=3 Tax=Monodelphis domestica TaxID=13616 RepID=UPI00028BDA48|nr:dyslexia-associated protein KIAA0319 homolog isoform X1 [Monodelphis domestica]XP_016287234.1 dyslexia-associated protein KIAA0319 homolog isoform X1 [Monodelphis domestica]XP_056679487.1 dyslexia-associated protein KIAA0319 homolog isoform X1 [Monodelphis domestica]
MWHKMIMDSGVRFVLLLLGAIAGSLCEQCRDGRTFSNAVISPNLESIKILRVPQAGSMAACTVACCDFPSCDLAWWFEHRCYVVNCQHQGSCEPKTIDPVQSYLTFVLRPARRPPPLLGYAQRMPSRLHPSQEASRPRDLPFWGKGRGLEELPEYGDDYRETEQDFFQASGKQVPKGAADYTDWGLLPSAEGPFNSSGGNGRSLGEERNGNARLEYPARGNASEWATVLDHFPEGRLSPTLENIPLPGKTREKEEAFQPPGQTGNRSGEEVLMPSHNPPSANLEFSPTSMEKSPNLTVTQRSSDRDTEVFPTDIGPSQSILTEQPTPPPTAPKTVKELMVFAGGNLLVTLPQDDIELKAFVVPASPSETSYNYEWSLISHPEDYQGEIEQKYTQTLNLSQLPVGFYCFKVTVSGENAFGEGFVNVTVKPAMRNNQLPVAIASPQVQELSSFSTSAVIDGSQSTDDTKIVSYHWEEIQGPQREQKVSVDSAVLQLSNLVPGNYTFRLTVIDSDGAANSTNAILIVNKPVDYPPFANAGPNQVITLPKNFITLNGNQSSDDHQIISYEWSLSQRSKSKEVVMQGEKTPYLQLSGMKEGDYIFQLTITDSLRQQSTTEVNVRVQTENSPPIAVIGPDKELIFPVESMVLDGSRSTDDQGIIFYRWENISGPSAVVIENIDQPVATVTGLQVGTYHFRLTVKDSQGLSSMATLSVAVREENNIPPRAWAGGRHILVLPNNTITLDGSKSTDDRGIVSYLWMRDSQSPAAGDIIYDSDHSASLQLINLVEGIYIFHLKVTDLQGDSDIDTATVEVRPDPKKGGLVELILQVEVGQLTEQQKGMLLRQLSALLNVPESDIKIQRIQAHSDISTVITFYMQGGQPPRVIQGAKVAHTLRAQLLKEKEDFLLFKVLRIDTEVCHLECSGHGHCDPITKSCICYQLWMENLIQRYLSDGESNCEWSIFYVTLLALTLIIIMMVFIWLCICCCKRQKRTKIRKKTKYTILDNIDDQERVELRPKFGIKHRSVDQNSSLMVSESEFESDQDTIFSREVGMDNSKNSMFGSIKNGITFSYCSKDR